MSPESTSGRPRVLGWIPASGSVLWGAMGKFGNDGLTSAAAALSYTTVFSLPALLSLLLLILGAFSDVEVVQRAIIDQVHGLIGQAGAEQIASILSAVRKNQTRMSVTAAFSIVALIIGATAAFGQLQAALNQAWEVKAQPKGNQFLAYVKKRIFSFGLIIGIGFLLLSSLAISTGLTAFGASIDAHLPDALSARLLAVLTTVVSLLVLSGLFALMFRYLPDARIAWRDVRVGAVATALLFVLGKSAIGSYLGRSNPGSAFGAAGSLAVVLIWVYYTSMIVLYGAEITRVWADRYGGGVRPDTGAVEVVTEEHTVSTGSPR